MARSTQGYRWTHAIGMPEVHAVATDGTGTALCGLRHSSWLSSPLGGVRAHLRHRECSVALNQLSARKQINPQRRQLLSALNYAGALGLLLSALSRSEKRWLTMAGYAAVVNPTAPASRQRWAITEPGKAAF